jgi:hypothetical protein
MIRSSRGSKSKRPKSDKASNLKTRRIQAAPGDTLVEEGQETPKNSIQMPTTTLLLSNNKSKFTSITSNR